MSDQIIVTIVVAIALLGHIILFKWIKFKMDEGIIFKLFKDSSHQQFFKSKDIASETEIKLKRVCTVCRQSKKIQENIDKKQLWCLSTSK